MSFKQFSQTFSFKFSIFNHRNIRFYSRNFPGFARVDDKGNKRDLHTKEALAALDYEVYPEYKSIYDKKLNEPVHVVSCPYFTTNILEFTQPVSRNYSFDSFVIHVCVQGSYTLKYGTESLNIKMGDCVLIPATINKVDLETDGGFKILESYIEG